MTASRFACISLFACILWSGCSNVSFTEPMPLNRRNLTKFPHKWQGTWTDGGDLTVIISEHSFEGDDMDRMVLGEDALLRRFHGHLVVNQQEENGNWTVLLGKRSKDEFTLWQFDGNDEDAVEAWKSALNDSSITSNVSDSVLKIESYVLAPENNAAFRKLITQGGLTKSFTLKRVGP
jgi:hypothetical protein